MDMHPINLWDSAHYYLLLLLYLLLLNTKGNTISLDPPIYTGIRRVMRFHTKRPRKQNSRLLYTFYLDRHLVRNSRQLLKTSAMHRVTTSGISNISQRGGAHPASDPPLTTTSLVQFKLIFVPLFQDRFQPQSQQS